MDWFKQANEMTNTWLDIQRSMFESFTSTDTSSQESAPDYAFQTNPMLSMFYESGRKLAQQYAQVLTPVKPKTTEDYMNDYQKAAVDTVTEAWASNEAFWKHVGESGSWLTEQDGKQFFESLQSTMSPEKWLANAFGTFGLTDKKFTDSPTFAGVTGFDRKIASASDNWKTLQQKSSEYGAVVMTAWGEAYEVFRKNIEAQIAKGAPPESWKEISDKWITTANDILMQLHKSDDFLAAQKKVIDATSEYRLAEQEIAEEFCKLFHLPTRTEIDQLHKKVYEMNKLLREQSKADRQGAATARKNTTTNRGSKAKKTPAAQKGEL